MLTRVQFGSRRKSALTVACLPAVDTSGATQAMVSPQERAQASSAWGYFELPINHMLANNMPEETARLLELIAGAA